MSYARVIPRDLFNEANLLKCLGKMVLLIQDDKVPGLGVEHAGPTRGFVIEQDTNDGSISVSNFYFYDRKGKEVHFWVPLNSRDAWPLVMEYLGEEYYPLNSEGEYQCSAGLFA